VRIVTLLIAGLLSLPAISNVIPDLSSYLYQGSSDLRKSGSEPHPSVATAATLSKHI
jgi:hypothetical protein